MTNKENPSHLLAGFLANLNEIGMEPITEWAKGYRASLEAAGYSPTIAEHIAAQAQIEMQNLYLRKVFT